MGSKSNGKSKSPSEIKPEPLPEIPRTVQRSFEEYWIGRLDQAREKQDALDTGEMKLLLQAFDQNCFGDPDGSELMSSIEGEPDVAGRIKSQWAM